MECPVQIHFNHLFNVILCIINGDLHQFIVHCLIPLDPWVIVLYILYYVNTTLGMQKSPHKDTTYLCQTHIRHVKGKVTLCLYPGTFKPYGVVPRNAFKLKFGYFSYLILRTSLLRLIIERFLMTEGLKFRDLFFEIFYKFSSMTTLLSYYIMKT